MKIVFRNLTSVIRRFKLAMSLNILGLSVAFAAFMVIMIQLDYDYSFDKCHKDYDKIFRLEMYVPQLSPTRVPMFNRPFAERFFESSPHIVAGALTTHSAAAFGGGETFFHVEIEEGGTRNYFKEKSVVVQPEFFDIFSFDFVEGSTDVYIAPGNVIIPLSMKRKIFGNESAVGRQIVHDGWGNQTVLAVYRDFPANTILQNCLYFAMQPEENKDNWGNWNYNAFIRVNDASNAPLLVDNFFRTLEGEIIFGEPFDLKKNEEMGITMYLTALPDIHFLPDMQYDFAPKASWQTLFILLAIAFVIIAIAAINFTNFSTALTPMRIKNINTMRVLGVRRNKIRLSIISEAVFFGLLSYLVALLLVALFNSTQLARLVEADLSLAAHPAIYGGTALVALLAGFLAGAYPARYMTSFAPALVLKGSFALSPKGRKLRNTLIGFQFVASFALIIGASFMYLQNWFMQHSHLGYDRDGVIIVETERITSSRDAFANQIKTYSGVDDITFAAFLLSSADGYSKWGVQYKGEEVVFQVIPVHYSFFDVMGIEVTEGRNFRQSDENSAKGVYIFNESARKQFGFELNEIIEGWAGGEIIGFMSDIKFSSFRMAVEPMAFYVMGTENRWGQANFTYIKLNKGTNIRAAMSYINTTLTGYNTNYPFEVRFFDEVIQRLYEKETALSTLISLFSILAIFISIVGVFGLVVFDSECRRKEIGIRKVLGASTMGIIIMFNKAYFKILVICFVMAAPVAWYAVHRWLENFAYKTPMYWWVYLMAFVVVAVITACTVTFQNWRVASDNPLKAIKSE
jgi:putative ABC transport system permease protein